jgi:hypothetical protein
MRYFLKDKFIVGCVGVWSEGSIIRYSIDNLLKWCDKVVICMDYPSEEVEKIVNEYKFLYPDIIETGYTTAPKLRNPANLKRRAKVNASQIVEDKLKIVKKIHKVRPIDILLTPDSDEVFSDYLPELLESFWESDRNCVFIKPVSVFDNPYIITEKSMNSHFRICKYREDISFTPRRYFDFLRPYSGSEAMKVKYYFTHLSQIREAWPVRDRLCDKRLVNDHPNMKLFKVDKPAWEIKPEEFDKILTGKELCLIRDYVA